MATKKEVCELQALINCKNVEIDELKKRVTNARYDALKEIMLAIQRTKAENREILLTLVRALSNHV